MTSPRPASPAAISIAANAPHAAAMRRARTSRAIFITRPSRAAKITSMEKRMPNVCTALHGAMTSAVPGASPSRPSSPRRRASESPAISMASASAVPVRVTTSRGRDGVAAVAVEASA